MELSCRSLNFWMAGMADKDQVLTFFFVTGSIDVNLGHQGTGGIEIVNPALLGL